MPQAVGKRGGVPQLWPRRLHLQEVPRLRPCNLYRSNVCEEGRQEVMGIVEGLQKRKVLLEVTLLDEDDLTDEKVSHECWKALCKASRAMYPELEVKVVSEGSAQ